MSDHQVQIVDLFLPVPKTTPCSISVRSFRNCSWKDLREALLTAPWQLLSIYDDIDDMWNKKVVAITIKRKQVASYLAKMLAILYTGSSGYYLFLFMHA